MLLLTNPSPPHHHRPSRFLRWPWMDATIHPSIHPTARSGEERLAKKMHIQIINGIAGNKTNGRMSGGCNPNDPAQFKWAEFALMARLDGVYENLVNVKGIDPQTAYMQVRLKTANHPWFPTKLALANTLMTITYCRKCGM